MPPTSRQIEQQTSVKLDADKNLWSYESPAYSGAQLRASREQRTGLMSWQLYVTVQSDDWPLLDRAYLLGGTPLDVVKINTDENCHIMSLYWGRDCDYTEVVGVSLDEQILSDAAGRGGLKVEVRGRSADSVVHLPGYFVEGFLTAVRDHRSRLPSEGS